MPENLRLLPPVAEEGRLQPVMLHFHARRHDQRLRRDGVETEVLRPARQFARVRLLRRLAPAFREDRVDGRLQLVGMGLGRQELGRQLDPMSGAPRALEPRT